jgi:hypothetical protein
MGRGAPLTKYEEKLIQLVQKAAPSNLSNSTISQRAKSIISIFRKLGLSPARTPSLKWLDTQQQKVFDGIKDLTLANTSKTVLYSTASVVSKWLNYTAAHELYSKESTTRAKETSAKVATQIRSTTQKEKWVTFDSVKEHVDSDLMPPFRALVAEGKEITDHVDKQIVAKALAGYLNVYEPPCRDVYSKAIFNNKPPRKDLKVNIVYLKKKGNAVLYVNSDKVTNQEIKTGNLGKDHWELASETTKILEQSLKIWPRIFIFSDDEEPSHKYSRLVENALSSGGKQIGMQIWRTIFSTHYYDTHEGRPVSGGGATASEKELARKMRHSVETQRAVYRKVPEAESNESEKETEEEEHCPQDFQYAENPTAVRAREYYQKHKTQQQERMRLKYQQNRMAYGKARLLKDLNAGTRKAHESTMKKWGIECKDGVYS